MKSLNYQEIEGKFAKQTLHFYFFVYSFSSFSGFLLVF